MGRGPQKFSPARTLALTYGAFGALWILVSDNVLAFLIDDPHVMTLAQTSKGWLFVFASAMLILVVGSRLLAALDGSERRYRMLFADSPQPMALYSPETGRFVEVNEAAARLLAYPARGIAGLPVEQLLVHEDRPEARRLMMRARNVGDAFTSIRLVQTGDGRRIQVEVRSSTVTYEDRLLRLILLTDVTARLQTEAALIGALDKLGRHESERDQLAHALSHDLREPIRQVAGFIQLLERRYQGQLSPEADQWIGFATEGVHRLNQLLADAQAFTAPPAMAAETVAVGELLPQVMTTLDSAITATGAMLCIGEMPAVEGDRRALAAVLLCVLDNSMKFRRSDRPCRITVTAGFGGGRWTFKVRDNGIGIEPEYRDTVFTLFNRLHTRDRVPGNGTGLALARKLMESMGGSIWVDECEGDGALMCFSLPGGTGRAAGPTLT